MPVQGDQVAGKPTLAVDATRTPQAGNGHHTAAAGVGAPVEVELKYDVRDREAFRAWLDQTTLAGVSAGPWHVRRDRDRYVDTPDGALAAAGYAARLRQRGGTTTLTLKTRAGAPADSTERPALHHRVELEGPASAVLDPATWPASDARDALLSLLGHAALEERFEIRQRRNVRLLTAADGGSAELSLDEVQIREAGRLAGRLTELEVEAIGDPVILERIAPTLEASGMLRPEPRSKEQRGAALVETRRAATGAGGAAALPRFPGVRPDDTLAMAGRKVLSLNLSRMLAAEPGTRSGLDPEDLHKMRVATRRMRAAWRVFSGAYRRRFERRAINEIRVVAGALGAVRDLDVQLDGLASYRAALPASGAAAMAPLADDWAARREAARLALRRLLDAPAYSTFVEDYRAFVASTTAGDRPPAPGEPCLVRDVAGGRAWLAYERVRAHDAALRWADPPALHALRIDAKRLRYTLEFFREPFPPRVEGLIAALVQLQDHLGALNDADVAARTSRQFLVAGGARLPAASREAIGHFLESRELEIVHLRRQLPPLWHRVSGPGFRRTLASVIAGL
jgi:CHAD domain-containing protein